MKRTLSIVLTLVMLLSALAVIPVSAASILTPNRTLAEQPALQYTDSTETVYKAGYVLHNMDFSKVTDFASTGYFVTNDFNPATFEIADGALHVQGNGKTNMLLTGNSIPKNMQDYTVELDFSFLSGSKYLCFLHGHNVSAEGKVSGSSKNTCFRTTGVIDNTEVASGAENAVAINAAIAAHKKVTASISVVDRNVKVITITCDDKTIVYNKTSNNESIADTYLGLMFGAENTEINLYNVRVIAGSKGDYTALTWPTGKTAGDLVQTVTSEAVVSAPLAADEYYNVNFAWKYAALGLTASTDAATVNGLGVDLVNMNLAGKNVTEGNFYTKLTADGLEIANVKDRTAGFVLSQCDLKSLTGSYVIEAVINFKSMDPATTYPYFGFGFDATQGKYDGYVSGTNMRFNNATAGMLFNSGYATTADKAVEAWTKICTDKQDAKFSFIVENKDGKQVCSTILVTIGDTTYTYAGGSLDASSGTFGITLRANAADCNPVMLLKSLVVKNANYEAPAGPTNILTPNRVLATQPTISYEDTVDTKYVPGYVLHHMDFSKVTDFASTGYFVTNDAEPVGFEIANDALHITTNASDGVRVMMAGNSIPKNMQDYTVQFKYRFVGTSTSYFVYIHGNKIGEDGKISSETNTCVRYNGEIDNCPVLTKYEAEWAALVSAMQAGKWVTFTYAAMERNTYRIIMECDNHTVEFIKEKNTGALEDSFMGFMVGRGTELEISTITVTAGCLGEDFEWANKVWPTGKTAGDLVQTVAVDAVAAPEDDTTVEDVTTEEPTQEEEDTTEEPTDVADVTTDDDDTTTETPKADDSEGCKSAVPAVAGVAAIIAIAIPFVKKSRKED